MGNFRFIFGERKTSDRLSWCIYRPLEDSALSPTCHNEGEFFIQEKMSNFISTLVAQFPVMLDIQHNLDIILSILSQAEPNTLVILPEGALSGYAEDLKFLDEINQQLLELALRKLQEVAVQSNIHLIFGSCLLENGGIGKSEYDF